VVFVAPLALALAYLPPLSGQPPAPDDPFFHSRGSWGQSFDDQWGLKRIGFTRVGSGSAWDIETGERNRIVIALIDTGLDHAHPDLRKASIWQNPREILNGRDDDLNGYVDDVMGWNFVEHNNFPWDYTGHGTHVAGIVAATNNGAGIAGVSWGARIMPLKVLDSEGQGRSVGVTEAIFYAVKKGARVINLSLGGEHLSSAEKLAVDYAVRRNVVVVVAAGNSGKDTAGYGPGGLGNVIMVAATDVDDKRAPFSNWGRHVRIAAPGTDILSLRARSTSLGVPAGAPREAADKAFLGPDKRYLRLSGTSFAAPFVSGAASLLLAQRPSLTAAQVERMLLMSADDVDAPGWDLFTGYGRLNVRRALEADPGYSLYSELHRLATAREGGQVVVQAFGTVAGTDLRDYAIELGQGETPSQWKPVGNPRTQAVEAGLLGAIPVREITARGLWTVRLVARDTRGAPRESRQPLNIR
jgi:subtilisin family serine protease